MAGIGGFPLPDFILQKDYGGLVLLTILLTFFFWLYTF